MSLEHPNVVPIHDAGDIDGRLYLAMRHVEGTDLRALLRAEGALEPARALAICSQVANALDAAHAKGLVHRDVKPSNVLLDASEHVYLADFGLTRRLDEQGGPAGEGRSVGTPAYLAPEQIEGGSVDGRADVYSLGCLLYECLTGETPFARGSRLAVAWAHLEEEPPSASERRPELPEAIDAVIRKAMAKEPEDRYTTCAALISAAEEALGLRRSPPLHRRKALLLVAAVLVACARRGSARGRSRRPAVTPRRRRPRCSPERTRLPASIPRRTRSAPSSPSGRRRCVAAAGGHSVWVYNQGDSTVSEIDAQDEPRPEDNADRRRARRRSAASPARCWPRTRPVPGSSTATRPAATILILTQVLPGGRGKREYRLDVTPTGVAVGDGAVWVVGRARTRLPGAAHRSGHGPRHGADAVPRLRADRLDRLRAMAPSGSSARPTPRSTGSTLARPSRTGRLVLGSRAPPGPRSCLAAATSGSGWPRRTGHSASIRLTLTIVEQLACGPPDCGRGQRGPRRALVVRRGRPGSVVPAGGRRRAAFARSMSRDSAGLPTGRASPRSRSAREASG